MTVPLLVLGHRLEAVDKDLLGNVCTTCSLALEFWKCTKLADDTDVEGTAATTTAAFVVLVAAAVPSLRSELLPLPFLV